jgi:ubiquinone/menaquinone biosynthesis C-methylase UbiE
MSNKESIDGFYDDIVEEYADGIDESPIRQHCLLPAVQSLLPDVDGKRVLDAACGTGMDSAWLAEQGASVVGIDFSREMIRTAKERHGDAVEFKQADLREPIESLGDGSFDIVSSQLTLSHLESWDTVLGEFHRILSEDGVLVVSSDHPFRQFLMVQHGEFSDYDLYAEGKPDVIPETDPSNYYEVEQYDLAYGPDGSHVISFYQRPMSAYIQSFLDAGIPSRRRGRADAHG